MAPSLSVVVVAYGMARELPRTLRTLAPPFQRDIDLDDYEVVVVDNGTPGGLAPSLSHHFPGALSVHSLEHAPASPARAANQGIEFASGEIIGLIIDGARMASPGLLATARLASGLATRPVITSPAYHLGPTTHMDARGSGYDEHTEDDLLASTRWEDDGYELFGISTLAGSSGRGWFGPMGESSALFMPKELWAELGGLDERFTLPGGGLVNHDLYRRACARPGVQLVALLGEGTFHQLHGGAATARRYTWDEMHADYREIRGDDYRPPENAPIYIGGVPTAALAHLKHSAQLAIERDARLRGRSRTK